ncbi:MAG: hypothetical protein COA53_03390 [Rhodobacteraceae bacterium]|nr:MAG: hypothetical protein COA53_03390 [Paracoccaceae bacterium]
MIALVQTPDRLRREYFQKKEDAPLLRGYRGKGDFSLYSHRLSSLYRHMIVSVIWLIKRIQIGFSFSKILKSTINQKVTA